MALQRRNFGLSRPVAPKNITFVLQGRRTLSELLPAETIDVPITVAKRSPYFRRVIMEQTSGNRIERQIELPDIDPVGFRMYIEWLQSGRVEFATPALMNTSSGILLRDSFDLIFAHIAGSQIDEVDFQDYVIDHLAGLLDKSQTPDLKVLEVVFLETGASNILKQFVVDRMFAVERKMLDMMRGFVGCAQTAVGCEYHVHEAGKCYRDNMDVNDANILNSPTEPHNASNSSRTSAQHGSEHFRSSAPTFHCTTRTASARFYNMAESANHGSAERSREVRGLSRKPDPPNDKPLPTIPPPTSETPPISSSLTYPYQSVRLVASNAQAISTQQLVSECLACLPRTENSSVASSSTSNSSQPAVQVLILECLERFKRGSPEDTSTFSLEDSLSTQSPSPNKSMSHGKPMPESCSVDNPRGPLQVHWQPSYDELPKPLFTESPASPSILPQSSDLSMPSSFSPVQPSLPSHISTVKRKAVPLRGEDWLKQYDSINALMKDRPTVVAKRSRKSKSRELLRNDSTVGRIELEGSMLKVRNGTEGAM